MKTLRVISMLSILILISCTDNKQSTENSPSKPVEPVAEEVIMNIKPTIVFPTDPQEQWDFMVQAVTNGNLDQVKFGIANSFDVNQRKDNCDRGLTLLHISAYEGQTDIFDFLISQGADINALVGGEDQGYFNPALYTVFSDNVDSLKYIMNSYSNKITNIFNPFNECLYHDSLRYFAPNILTYLIDELNYPIDDSAIESAVTYMNTNTLEYLFQRGITNINATNWQGETPLDWIMKAELIREVFPSESENTITWLTQKLELLEN